MVSDVSWLVLIRLEESYLVIEFLILVFLVMDGDNRLSYYSIYFQDMQDMRECYDRLLSVAAATANSAFGKYAIMNLHFYSFFHKFRCLMLSTVMCMVSSYEMGARWNTLELYRIELTSIDTVACFNFSLMFSTKNHHEKIFISCLSLAFPIRFLFLSLCFS